MNQKNENVGNNGPIRITTQSGTTILVDDPFGTVRIEMKNGKVIENTADNTTVVKQKNRGGEGIKISPNGSVYLETENNLKIKAGKAFEVQSETITLNALNITAKAALNVEFSGINITSKAALKNRTEGHIIENQAHASHNTASSMISAERTSLFCLKTPVAVQISSDSKRDLELAKLQEANGTVEIR